MYQERFYRNIFKGANLLFFDVCVYETDLKIGASKNLYKEALLNVMKYRKQIEDYTKLNPEFLRSEPVKIKEEALVKEVSPIVGRMISASQRQELA